MAKGALVPGSDLHGNPSYGGSINCKSEDLALTEDPHWRLVAAGFSVWLDEVRLEPGVK